MAPDEPPKREETHNSVRRRRFLLTAAGASTFALAGCSGGGGGGDGGDGADGGGSDGGDGGDGGGGDGGGPSGRITMLTTPDGTTGNVLANGMMSVVTQNTDLTGSAQAGSGSTQNLVQLMRGEAQFTSQETSTAVAGYRGEEPVDVDTEYKPLQCASFFFLRLSQVVPVDSEFEYITDLDGEPMGLGPQAAGYQSVLKSAYNKVLDDFTPAHQGLGDLAGALKSGQISSSVHMNVQNVQPGFIQQLVAQNDVRAVGWREETAQVLREDPDINTFMLPNDTGYSNVKEFVTEPETLAVAVNAVVLSTADVSAEVVYTVLKTVFENREALPDIAAAFNPWTDADFWTQLVDTRLPFHPGAARFLREKDLWSEEFEEADV